MMVAHIGMAFGTRNPETKVAATQRSDFVIALGISRCGLGQVVPSKFNSDLPNWLLCLGIKDSTLICGGVSVVIPARHAALNRAQQNRHRGNREVS